MFREEFLAAAKGAAAKSNMLKKKRALQKFSLINGFSNVCGCSSEEIGSKSFAEHIKNEHKGYIPANS